MDKKISQLTPATIPLSGSDVLPIVQGGQTVKATVQDIVLNGVNLTFFWNKESKINSARINGDYMPLGINFNNLTIEPGVTYTLLIDRWRRAEKKNPDEGPGGSPQFRVGQFYHELNPSANGRQNEIQITSTSQVFDFNQDFYFREPTQGFPRATGYSTRSYVNGGSTQTCWMQLGFRIRIDDPIKGVYETPILSKVIMTAVSYDNGNYGAIGYSNI